MSKSMWCDAVDSKPVRNEMVTFLSVDVLFWAEEKRRPYWGHYNYNISEWLTSDQRGHTTIVDKSTVHHFAYIDNPYK